MIIPERDKGDGELSHRNRNFYLASGHQVSGARRGLCKMILHHRMIIMTKGISLNGFKCLIDVILEIMNVHMTVCG